MNGVRSLRGSKKMVGGQLPGLLVANEGVWHEEILQECLAGIERDCHTVNPRLRVETWGTRVSDSFQPWATRQICEKYF